MQFQAHPARSLFRRLRCGLLVVCGLLLAHLAGPAPASAAPPQVLRWQVGFQGHYKVGDWTPVILDVESDAAIPETWVTLSVPDPDGQFVRHKQGPFSLIAGQTQIPLLVRPGRLTGDWQLRIEDAAGQPLVERTVPTGTTAIPAAQQQTLELWGSLGLPTGWEEFAIEAPRATASTSAAALAPTEKLNQLIVTGESPALIPETFHALDALDVLILTAGKAGADGRAWGSSLTAQQVAVLRDWVEYRGGHLILSLGQQPEEFAKSPLGRWLQFPFVGSASVRRLDGLEEYSRLRLPIKLTSAISTLRIAPTTATVLASGLDGPLILQHPTGNGRVTLITVDLDHPALATWGGIRAVLQRVTRWEREVGKQQVRLSSQHLTRSGINDLQTQVVHGLDHFPQVTRVSLWMVMLGIGLYLAIVGPLDYFLVHRLWKKPHLTWVTFPTWVVLGTVAATALANQWNGRSLLTQQWDLVDIDVASQLLRGRSWFMIYSPQTQRLNVSTTPVTKNWPGTPLAPTARALPAPALSWLGTAETSVGGMYRTSGLQISSRSYVQSATSWENFPAPVWSSIGGQLEWSQPVNQAVTVDFTSSGVGRLTGTLTHQLPGTIEDCLLAFGNRVYLPVRRKQGQKVNELPPHQVWDIGGGQQFEQRELRGLLTQTYTRVIRDNGKVQGKEIELTQTPYDLGSRDPNYILKILTFHQAAGGESYTGVRHDFLHELDLSSQLRLGRAVLFGRIRHAASEWTVNGEKRAAEAPLTFVRLVLPVQQLEESTRTLVKPDEGLKLPAAK